MTEIREIVPTADVPAACAAVAVHKVGGGRGVSKLLSHKQRKGTPMQRASRVAAASMVCILSFTVLWPAEAHAGFLVPVITAVVGLGTTLGPVLGPIVSVGLPYVAISYSRQKLLNR